MYSCAFPFAAVIYFYFTLAQSCHDTLEIDKGIGCWCYFWDELWGYYLYFRWIWCNANRNGFVRWFIKDLIKSCQLKVFCIVELPQLRSNFPLSRQFNAFHTNSFPPFNFTHEKIKIIFIAFGREKKLNWWGRQWMKWRRKQRKVKKVSFLWIYLLGMPVSIDIEFEEINLTQKYKRLFSLSFSSSLQKHKSSDM